MVQSNGKCKRPRAGNRQSSGYYTNYAEPVLATAVKIDKKKDNRRE